MSRIEEVKKEFVARINDSKRTIELLDKLSSPPDCVRILSITPLTVEIHSMEDLHTTRRWLRHDLKSWEDKRGVTWYSGGKMITEYEGTNHPINIWLSIPPDQFPKELQSDKCKVVKLPSFVRDNYTYICKEE